MQHREGPIFSDPEAVSSVFSGLEDLLQRPDDKEMPPLVTEEEMELISAFLDHVENKYPHWYPTLRTQSYEDILELAKAIPFDRADPEQP
jgi:hypothetical protein